MDYILQECFYGIIFTKKYKQKVLLKQRYIANYSSPTDEKFNAHNKVHRSNVPFFFAGADRGRDMFFLKRNVKFSTGIQITNPSDEITKLNQLTFPWYYDNLC